MFRHNVKSFFLFIPPNLWGIKNPSYIYIYILLTLLLVLLCFLVCFYWYFKWGCFSCNLYCYPPLTPPPPAAIMRVGYKHMERKKLYSFHNLTIGHIPPLAIKVNNTTTEITRLYCIGSWLAVPPPEWNYLVGAPRSKWAAGDHWRCKWVPDFEKLTSLDQVHQPGWIN